MNSADSICLGSGMCQSSRIFAGIHGEDGVEVFSAASRPSGVINPKAIAAMRKIGYDLTTHSSKTPRWDAATHTPWIAAKPCAISLRFEFSTQTNRRRLR